MKIQAIYTCHTKPQVIEEFDLNTATPTEAQVLVILLARQSPLLTDLVKISVDVIEGTPPQWMLSQQENGSAVHGGEWTAINQWYFAGEKS